MHICVHVYVCTYWYKDPCAAGSMRMWFVSHSNHLNFEARHHPFRVTPSFREATPSGARTRRDDWPGMVERVCPQMGHSHTPQLSFLTSCLHTCFFTYNISLEQWPCPQSLGIGQKTSSRFSQKTNIIISATTWGTPRGLDEPEQAVASASDLTGVCVVFPPDCCFKKGGNSWIEVREFTKRFEKI